MVRSEVAVASYRPAVRTATFETKEMLSQADDAAMNRL
jgi:hypothetical protein